MPPHELTARAPRVQDASALIGLLATLEGELITSGDDLPGLAVHLAKRLARDGLLSEQSGRALRQSLNDLNHRLRYVLGEYGDPIDPVPESD